MKQYNSLSEWKSAHPKEYEKAKREGDIRLICETMGWVHNSRKPNGYWGIKENVLESAKKHNTIKSWSASNYAAWQSSKKNGWFEECTAHMIKKNQSKPTKEECILNAKKYSGRWEWQKSEDRRYYNTAKINKWLDECCGHMIIYSKPNGYWTKEKCIEYAIKYNYPSDWEKGHIGSYAAARANGWYEELTEHMEFKIKPSGYWNNKQRCIDFIKTCTSKEDLKKKSPSVSAAIRRNGWYYELTAHFESRYKWNKETLLEEANKYKTVTEFSKNANGAYQTAIKKGWKDYVFQNLEVEHKPTGYWTKEKCREVANKCITKGEFNKKYPSASQSARRNGWSDELTAHMSMRNTRKRGNWQNKENCIEEALKYKTKSEWTRNSSGSYQSAKKNGWFDECSKHMK